MTTNTMEQFIANWTPPIKEPVEPKTRQVIKEGDILVAQWGYEANNVNYFKVLKRTAKFVVVAELNTEYVSGETGIYDGVYVQPGTTWKNWSLWADRDAVTRERTTDGQPITMRRKVQSYPNQDEYALLCSYAHMYLWNGQPQVDYNHH